MAGASSRSASSANWAAGDIEPRAVMILVEWASKAALDGYRNDPKIADLHPHREKGAGDYIWHLFDKLEDLRPILNSTNWKGGRLGRRPPWRSS